MKEQSRSDVRNYSFSQRTINMCLECVHLQWELTSQMIKHISDIVKTSYITFTCMIKLKSNFELLGEWK